MIKRDTGRLRAGAEAKEYYDQEQGWGRLWTGAGTEKYCAQGIL
jgi:hypothetical protein